MKYKLYHFTFIDVVYISYKYQTTSNIMNVRVYIYIYISTKTTSETIYVVETFKQYHLTFMRNSN